MTIELEPREKDNPAQFVKYRLYYGLADGTCVVRYDNETGKGDHRHIEEDEECVDTTDPSDIVRLTLELVDDVSL